VSVEPTVRVIARLDIKGPNLVKGIHLEGLRVLGKPESFARHYYEQGADELVYMDAVASLYERNSLLPIVQRTSREIFIPLTVGGGLRSVDDIRVALRSGADKVSLNTAAVQRPALISEAARRFGSSTITISIEAKRLADGRYEVFTDNGRNRTGIDVFEWAGRVSTLGAGEILLTSIDQEGTGRGFDTDLVRAVAQCVSIPVIACGGAGSSDDVVRVVQQGAADAVCVASILHYDCLQKIARNDDYSMEGNVEFLKSAQPFGRVTPTGLSTLKAALAAAQIRCRPVLEGPHA
jgi:imidazole glycerol-phosphate synthase subunit HisF